MLLTQPLQTTFLQTVSEREKSARVPHQKEGDTHNTKPSCSDIYIQIAFPDVAVETYVPPQQQLEMPV